MPITSVPRRLRGYIDDNLFDLVLSEALEYVPDLMWPTSVDTYGRMRRDPKLTAILDGYSLQLRRAQWQLDGTGCRPAVVKQLADDLGLPVAGKDRPGGARVRGLSWSQHLRAALTELAYGHAGFELQVDVSSGATRLAGVWPRPQWTISHLHVDAKTGQLQGATQNAAWKERNPQIGSNALVWYAREPEGAAWQGTSLLRPSFGPWLFKREMQRVLATANRRFGMGVPVVEWLPGTNPTPGQVAEAEGMAAAARVGDQAGASLPAGARLALVGLTGSAPDTLAFLKWLNGEMAGSVLMQHTELGQTETGSRALGESFIDSWLLALEALGEQVADDATRQIAARLVEWNWSLDEPVPRVVVSGIGSRREVTAESLQLLLNSGALDSDPALKAWVRREFRLPEQVDDPDPAPAPRRKSTPPAEPDPATEDGPADRVTKPATRRRGARAANPAQLALPIAADGPARKEP